MVPKAYFQACRESLPCTTVQQSVLEKCRLTDLWSASDTLITNKLSAAQSPPNAAGVRNNDIGRSSRVIADSDRRLRVHSGGISRHNSSLGRRGSYERRDSLYKRQYRTGTVDKPRKRYVLFAAIFITVLVCIIASLSAVIVAHQLA